MPPRERPWFRLHSQMLESRKAQKLKPALFKHWVNLLCLANLSKPRGALPEWEDIAFALRMGEDAARAVVEELVALRFIDALDDGLVMHNWPKWQFDSDANLTPGRRRRNADRTPIERAKNADSTPSARIDQIRSDQIRSEAEADQIRAADAFNIFRLFERSFGKLITPALKDSLGEMERDYPRDLIEYAFREAVELDKRSVRYVQAVCERQLAGGSDGRANGNSAPRGVPAPGPSAEQLYGRGHVSELILD